MPGCSNTSFELTPASGGQFSKTDDIGQFTAHGSEDLTIDEILIIFHIFPVLLLSASNERRGGSCLQTEGRHFLELTDQHDKSTRISIFDALPKLDTRNQTRKWTHLMSTNVSFRLFDNLECLL